METLYSLYPNVHDLLSSPPEDLSPILIVLAKVMIQNGMFQPDAVNELAVAPPHALPGQSGFPPQNRQRIESLLSQSWAWIERNDLVAAAGGMNGRNGWKILTSKAENIATRGDIQRLREATEFPRSMIHSSIAEKVWRSLMRGDLDEAVMFAFKSVEEAVRVVGGYKADDIGIKLVRDAFHKEKGPLTNPSQPEAEREALAHLFAGALGSYKNPHSHRTVKLDDLRDAQEQIVLASHLLRIVDSRRKI